MMKDTINKLYALIAKLVISLENELDQIANSKSKSAINIKKTITESLNKLVCLIIQLNKLSKTEMNSNEKIFPEEDKAIINQFLQKYSDHK